MRAPASCSVCMIEIDGASRISSVLGLKVKPKMAIVFPRTPPAAWMMRRPMARLRASFTAMVVSTRRIGLS